MVLASAWPSPPWLDELTTLPVAQDSGEEHADDVPAADGAAPTVASDSEEDADLRQSAHAVEELAPQEPLRPRSAESQVADAPAAHEPPGPPHDTSTPGADGEAPGDDATAIMPVAADDAPSPSAENPVSIPQRLPSQAREQLHALDERRQSLEALLARVPEPSELSAQDRAIQRLDRSIDRAAQRIAQYTDDRGVPTAIDQMKRSLDGLRRQLAVAERDRRRAIDDAIKKSELADREASARERAERRASLLERLSPNIGDGDLFIAECMERWEQLTEPADRTKYPWRTPILGERFLASVEKVRSKHEQVVRTCALAACGRIHEMSGASVHALRAAKGSTAPQLRREDGATAWRCSVSEGAGAVRLHYWQLSDGTIELVKVGYHDDTSM